MKRIDELFTDYPLEEIEDLDLVRLSEREEEDILKRTLEKAGLQQERVQKRKRRYVGIGIAAAALLVLGVSAYAAGYLQLDKRLSGFFHTEDKAQVEHLGSSGAVIGKSVENAGYTLSVEQIVGDRYSAYILLEMVAPAGTVLNQESYSFEMPIFRLETDEPVSMGYGIDQVEDDDPMDNKVSFILSASSDVGFAGMTGSFQFGRLQYYSIEKQDMVSVADGKWELSFPMEYTSASKEMKVNETVAFADGTAQLGEIYISPLSVSIVMEGESIRKYDENPPVLPGEETDGGAELLVEEASGTEEVETPDSQERLPVVIHFKDGSQITAPESYSSSIQGARLVKTCSYQKLMDVDQIQSISVGEANIPLQ